MRVKRCGSRRWGGRGHVEFRSFVLCFFSGCKQVFYDWLLTSFGRKREIIPNVRTFFLTFIFFLFFFSFFFFSFFSFFLFFFFSFFSFSSFFWGRENFSKFPREDPAESGAGEGKRTKIWAVRRKRSQRESAQILDVLMHIAPTHHMTQQQTTQWEIPHRVVLGPLTKVFWVKDGSQRGTKHQEAVWAKRGAGQMWSRKQKNMEKTRIKNNNQKNVAFSCSFSSFFF